MDKNGRMMLTNNIFNVYISQEMENMKKLPRTTISGLDKHTSVKVKLLCNNRIGT